MATAKECEEFMDDGKEGGGDNALSKLADFLNGDEKPEVVM